MSMLDRLRVTVMAASSVFCVLLALVGPRLLAQPTARDPNWVNVAIEVARNGSRISNVEAFVNRLEDAKLPDRIVKIESQLDGQLVRTVHFR